MLPLCFISLKIWAHRKPSAWHHSANIPSNGNEEWRKRINYESLCGCVCIKSDSTHKTDDPLEERSEKKLCVCVIRRGRDIIRLMTESELTKLPLLLFAVCVSHSYTTWIGFYLRLSASLFFSPFSSKASYLAIWTFNGRVYLFVFL